MHCACCCCLVRGFCKCKASLSEDSPGQGGAGRGSAPSSPSSGGQQDEDPRPQGTVASVHHWPCPVTPMTPLLLPASSPGNADTQRGPIEPVRLHRHGSGDTPEIKRHPGVWGVSSDPRFMPVSNLYLKQGSVNHWEIRVLENQRRWRSDTGISMQLV